MAYDEYLAERIEKTLIEKNISFKEMKMMGGIAYMVNDKMCVGITNNNLMARINPDIYVDALKRKGCRPMDFTGRPMKGWVFVSHEGIDTDEELAGWIQLALDFNPLAKSGKKKK